MICLNWKGKIQNINNNIKKDNNDNLLKKISDEISFIKENLEKNFKKNNKEKNNINEDYNKFLINNIAMMKPTKMYKCKNCGCSFMFNECFNIQNNKSFKEHNFQLENLQNNINKNEINDNNKEITRIKNNLPENVEEKNLNNEINNDKNEKKEEEKKEEKEENEDNNEIDNYEDDMKIQEILQKYFFNDKNELKCYLPTNRELNEIKNYYKILLEKNLDIENFQEKFIAEVNKEISKINDETKKKKAISRKERIEKLLKDLFVEIEREKKRKKNNHNWRTNYNYNY